VIPSTLDTTDPLAKRLRAHIAGWLAVEPNPHIADTLVAGMLPERVEPVPVPVPRRQRKRSLSKVCDAARKAGADRVIVDGVVIALSPAAAVSGSVTNEWDAVLEGDHGPN
jgi:hypothetical protein